ncbi:hypothetical protein BE20_24635 [Sorangium cellulosum]|uniref:DUF2946 domain-containing protein n=1 Tax=Sorangium cellulosum TaxID=56 RepID=A0A150S5Y1_SORCE|nr:hypothetical protein BE20_24635 [Sorangium cellulosum]KYF87886.1 hypothetical protein BE18_10985 [Sorangium cellulosum]
MSRVRRPHRNRSAILRWICAALSVFLVVGLVAQGHTFQALGVALACEHPMLEPSSSHDEGEKDAAPDGSHHDCPPSCSDCACGRIPMTLSLEVVLPYILLEAYEIPASSPPERPGRSPTYRLERPPRRPRA